MSKKEIINRFLKDGQSTSYEASSSRKRKAKDLTMLQSKRAKFCSTYISRQSFDLPGTIMFYILMNPKTAAFYQKLIKSCKYFFIKNPILIVNHLFHNDIYSVHVRWIVNRKPFDLSKLTCKVWITDKLDIYPGKKHNQSILSSLMPKLYRCDVKELNLSEQVITFHDLSLLISFAEVIYFYNVTFKNENGSNVALEEVVEIAVNAKNIKILSNTALTNISSKTFNELLKIPHFTQLDYFCMEKIPHTFDIEAFYVFMKNNRTTKFRLHFDDSVSQVYKNRTEEIVDEILATKGQI
uniref:Uncharacterized protein n=1 Tax=Panagrolaimus davidi TaxID=227884 RepID=A0A914PMA5_9BILA